MSKALHEPTTQQLQKFNEINELSESAFDRRCTVYNNCTLCPLALHIGLTKNRCTYGMSEMEFRLLLSSADCDY